MKSFTDAAGRTWTLGLNLGTALGVKEKLGVDLLQPEAGEPPLLTRLGTDELLLGEVLCALLDGQFAAHKVGPAEVRAAFDGRTLLAAQQAFYEELADFFRQRGRRDRARAVETQRRLIDAAVKAAEERLAQLEAETIPGATSGSSPARSDSTPGPSPRAS